MFGLDLQVATVSGHIISENVLAGIGAAVHEEIAPVTEFFAGILKVALGSAALGTLLEATKTMFVRPSESTALPEQTAHNIVQS